jgi:uncharacterized protein (DUF2062 family)
MLSGGMGRRLNGFLGAVVTSIVLVCAVLASLAVGVLVAYGVCMTMFRVFQMHVQQVAAERRSQVVASASAQVAKS